MFDVFGEVKKHITTSGRYKPEVSSSVFLTMKIGMLVTIMACVLVTAKNYIGDNINCITGFDDQEHKAIETYCFISSTFTMLDLTSDVAPHPGVGPKYPLHSMDAKTYEESLKKAKEEGDVDPSEDIRQHSYYQWVPIVLALQAAVYYIPIWLWTQSEKGYFEMILCGLHDINLDGDEADKIKTSARHFSKTINHHGKYAYMFLLCECIAFALAVANIFFTNTFLGGEFLNYGPNAMKYLNTPAYDPSNPLNNIFPKVAKCTWHKFGASGTVQTYDSMCVLPLNIVNEKTYIFLWVAYIAVAVITGVVLVYHILLCVATPVRNAIINIRTRNSTSKKHFETLLKSCNYGDWFLLYHLKAHMAYFPEWIQEVMAPTEEKK